MSKRKAHSPDDDELPNGQMLLMSLPEPTEGAELLVPAATQRELYPLTTVDRNQERLQSIIASLAADAPIRFVCRTHKVGWHTLQRIREEYGPKIATVKQGIAKRMALFVQLGVEQLLDDLAAGAIAPDKLGIIVGIIADKMQVLTGEPSVIVGSSEGAKQFSIETLNARLRARPVIDVSGTGLDGGKEPVTRASGPAGGALEVGGSASKPAASDAASENNHSQ